MPLTTARELFEALMGGGTAEELKAQADRLPYEEWDLLLAALYGVRDEVAATCQRRADEIDRLLNYSVHLAVLPAATFAATSSGTIPV